MKKITLLIIASVFAVTAFAQISVSGVVTNDSIPLESANVIVKNSTNGIATNQKGEFKLKVKKGDTLVVSYLGYETKEFSVSNERKVNIILEEGGLLDEVVVNAFDLHTCKLRCGVCFVYETRFVTDLNMNRLYPNPSSNGIFNLKLSEDYDEVKITVANMSGQIVKSLGYEKFGNQKQIDLSQFSTGIYIINIIADGKALESIKAVRN
ncbi:MAG: hypothetical protein CMC76_03530 [Flavobacteriaceae bacterium]|uniref:T9SS type A sorting domain-containing protein n=1 Tax=Winogradskyella sp. SYSU M77433 TaxID=3042722 RepID=UPI000C46297E|nr:carboxypeptidase-like regulatory domain-containing protein [Winogradskyella sp. SYSU M77433]MAX70160.1 hypothetical protein [Flavobacteriaceae bacterium]MDH7911844.1 carboxypeptidase-like regulatory domain-containing protein [Winogradskyella sp. SYSU M77433]|tara:strand:+ start:380 stop:1006 length:627 start_codon:yes stop_codon:yes gene_type:complete